MVDWYREGATKFNTFSFQGKEYPLGATVKIKNGMHTRTGNQLSGHPMEQVVEAYIDKHGTKRWTYALWKYNGNVFHYTTIRSPDEIGRAHV